MELIYVNGTEVVPVPIACAECGVYANPDYKYLESNRAIQIRCSECGKFYGNYRYAKPDAMTMPFGKHKGELITEIPEKYLEWLYFNCDLSKSLYEAVEAALYGGDANGYALDKRSIEQQALTPKQHETAAREAARRRGI